MRPDLESGFGGQLVKDKSGRRAWRVPRFFLSSVPHSLAGDRHALFFFFFFTCLFIFERGRENASGRGSAEGLCTDSREPNAGLELTDCEITT